MSSPKIIKSTIGLLAVLAILCICEGCILKNFTPNIKVKDVKVDVTKEKVERGRYLANHVLACIDCHSKRDWSKYSGPIVPGTEGMGGETYDQKMGLPGRYIATNITPYSLANWSDGEIYRAITSGVGKEDNTIFPLMPYAAYGTLDDEDIFCVIAYLRSMPSIKNDIPASETDFPVNLFINTMAKEGNPSIIPSKQDTIQYGKYITTAAACLDCHTQDDKGKLIMEKAYAGGKEFPMEIFGYAKIVSPNITFDKETGIGEMDKDVFINIFKYYDLKTYVPPTLEKGGINTPMPWTMYAEMDTVDLAAIYYYLKSLTPIVNLVKSKP